MKKSELKQLIREVITEKINTIQLKTVLKRFDSALEKFNSYIEKRN